MEGRIRKSAQRRRTQLEHQGVSSYTEGCKVTEGHTFLNFDEALSGDTLLLAQVAHVGRVALKVSFDGAYKCAYVSGCLAPSTARYGRDGEAHEFAREVGEAEEVVGQGEREELLCGVTFRYRLERRRVNY